MDSQISDHLQRRRTGAIEKDSELLILTWAVIELLREVWAQIWDIQVKEVTLENQSSNQLALLTISRSWALSSRLQHINNQVHHLFYLVSNPKVKRIQWVLQIWQIKIKMASIESPHSKSWYMILYHWHQTRLQMKLIDIETLQPTTIIHLVHHRRDLSLQIETQMPSTQTSMKNQALIWTTKTRLADHPGIVSNSKANPKWWVSKRISNHPTIVKFSLIVKDMADKDSTVTNQWRIKLLATRAASKRVILAKVTDNMTRGGRALHSRARTMMDPRVWQMV